MPGAGGKGTWGVTANGSGALSGDGENVDCGDNWTTLNILKIIALCTLNG